MRSKPRFPDPSLARTVSGVHPSLVVTVMMDNFPVLVAPPQTMFLEVHLSGRDPA